MSGSQSTGVDELRAFLDASPTPGHAVEAGAAILDAAGFTEVAADEAWERDGSRSYVRRDGSLIAWRVPEGASPGTPFRIVGAHTDSPGFRIKPQPESTAAGWRQLGVEVYGGPLLNSWLDRDLGVAGRVLVGSGSDSRVALVRDDRAVLRIPQLAIHLDRDIGERGLKLDRQRHLTPIWGVTADGARSFTNYVAELAGVEPSAVRAWDLAPFDLEPARVCGLDGELLASARLDDLFSAHAALRALEAAPASTGHVSVVALFDHEEVGSTSATGAGGQWLANVLERVGATLGADRSAHLRALAGSHGVSADMAHATHPNYAERHEPTHPIIVNAGPVVKINAQQRYATDLRSIAPFLDACATADVPTQRFVSNSSMPCGSTVGPMTAAGLGIPVVDVGVAQLAMHSVRELCGTTDHDLFVRALVHYLSPTA
jgi:aspartyl aminopeptidase